jgi:asparagine synthase (glutamine-hydrolysing)
MCGLAGFIQRGGGDAGELRAAARRMSDCLRHRGPDDEGVFADGAAGVALGFRRLAIIDLSPAGAQPMASASGRYTLIFNGEMYNFERLRRELDGPWRGHSDTEVILAAFEAWGVRRAVERFIGMFAFAVWDARERTLILGRDRAGVKPLYITATSDRVLFASEIKALDVAGGIDRGAFALYARYGYVPAPYAMVENVRKVRPGTLVTIDAALQVREETYWDAREVAANVAPFQGDETEAVGALDELLADSVALRMIADVPLGVFLSGGIDSSVVTAQMARSGQTVKSYTIGFEDRDLDEADAAAAVAAHFGTSHTQLYARADDAREALTRMPEIFDEPLGDTSQVPTYLVARLARPHVTVALSGDGGDELFGGYSHYYLRRQLQRRAERVPAPVRRPVGAALRAASRLAKGRMRERLASYGGALHGRGLVAQWLLELAETRLTRHEAPPFILTSPESWPALDDPSAMQMWLDFMAYLPDDILAKVDRATMAVSLEAREPLLDHRLIEFAWSLPPALRDRKRALREVLYRYIPRALVDREKRGFGLPIGAWLRGPLRGWVESLLPTDDAYFDAAAVRSIWEEHLRGASNESLIWRVVMFEGWRRKPDW